MVWIKWPFSNKSKQENTQAVYQSAKTETNPQIKTQTYFRSSSRSRTCKSDPQDPGFLICKEKSQDGNNISQKEERVPVNTPMMPFTFPTDQSQDSLHNNFFAQFEKEFGMPFFGSFFTPFFGQMSDFSQFPQYGTQTSRKEQRREQKSFPKQDARFYFNGNEEKDFSIKDL